MIVRKLVPFLPAVLWAVAVWIIGGLPGTASPIRFAGADKVAHFAMYGILGWLVGRAWFGEERRVPWLLPLVLVLMVGAADEVRQRTVSRRSADVRDWVADAAGAAAGLLIARRGVLRRARKAGKEPMDDGRNT